MCTSCPHPIPYKENSLFSFLEDTGKIFLGILKLTPLTYFKTCLDNWRKVKYGLAQRRCVTSAQQFKKNMSKVQAIGQRSRYSHQSTGWTAEEFWFHFRQGQDIFNVSGIFRSLLRLIEPPILCRTRAISPERKRLEGEYGHLPPSSDEVKNDWSYTYIHFICLHSLHTNKLFTLKA